MRLKNLIFVCLVVYIVYYALIKIIVSNVKRVIKFNKDSVNQIVLNHV